MNRVIIIIVILFVLLVVMKKTDKILNSESEDSFIPSFVAWLKKKEGGISKDKSDPASSNSWPDGSHTNIGITKTTFEANANKCGYDPTFELFKLMPPEIWWCNYQGYYLKGLNYSSNLILSTYMAQWFWGGWDKSLMPESKVLEALSTPTARSSLNSCSCTSNHSSIY